MSHKILFDPSFHSLLFSIDQELARDVQQKGCSCGGKLEHGDYPRSPMGVPIQFRSTYDKRISFCCGRCRKRSTPPSVRFFGRRWFPAPFFLLISVLSLGMTERRLQQVKRHFGIIISESTWKRWRRWWRLTFIETPFWQASKGLIPTVAETEPCLPRTLLSAFGKGQLKKKLPLLLRFLVPLTIGNCHVI